MANNSTTITVVAQPAASGAAPQPSAGGHAPSGEPVASVPVTAPPAPPQTQDPQPSSVGTPSATGGIAAPPAPGQPPATAGSPPAPQPSPVGSASSASQATSLPGQGAFSNAAPVQGSAEDELQRQANEARHNAAMSAFAARQQTYRDKHGEYAQFFQDDSTGEYGDRATKAHRHGKASWFGGLLEQDVFVNKGQTTDEAELTAGRAAAARAYALTNAGAGIAHQAFAMSPTADLSMMASGGNALAQYGMMSGNPYLAVGGAVAQATFGQLAQSGNYLYGKGTELAQLERYREMVRGTGANLDMHGETVGKAVHELGFKPGEATWLMQGYYGAVGHKDAAAQTSGISPLEYYQRLGVGIGQQSHFMSLHNALQGGTPQQLLDKVIGTGEGMGLRNDQLTQFLSRIAAATEGMRDRGLKLDAGAVAGMAASLTTSTGSDPQRSAILSTGLSQSSANLAQGMVGGFGGIADVALLSQAAKGGGDYFDVVGRMQEWSSDPRQVFEQLKGAGLSGKTLKAALMGKGWNEKEAQRAVDTGIPDAGTKDGRELISDHDSLFEKIRKTGLNLSRGFAEADLEVDKEVLTKDNTEAIRALTNVLKEQQKRNISLGGVTADLEQGFTAMTSWKAWAAEIGYGVLWGEGS